MWLLCSDGVRNLAGDLPTTGGIPVHAMSAAATADHDLLRLLAHQTGGTLSQLGTESSDEVVLRILNGDRRLVAVDAPASTSPICSSIQNSAAALPPCWAVCWLQKQP